jgi:hypothetical protein
MYLFLIRLYLGLSIEMVFLHESWRLKRKASVVKAFIGGYKLRG